VRTKMQHKEFIILCLEDSSDWSNATTRSIVMQVQSLWSPWRLFHISGPNGFFLGFYVHRESHVLVW
jgi:hypothetical protein